MTSVNELMWSENVDRAANELSISGISVTTLAKEFGTPAFILDGVCEGKTSIR